MNTLTKLQQLAIVYLNNSREWTLKVDNIVDLAKIKNHHDWGYVPYTHAIEQVEELGDVEALAYFEKYGMNEAWHLVNDAINDDPCTCNLEGVNEGSCHPCYWT